MPMPLAHDPEVRKQVIRDLVNIFNELGGLETKEYKLTHVKDQVNVCINLLRGTTMQSEEQMLGSFLTEFASLGEFVGGIEVDASHLKSKDHIMALMNTIRYRAQLDIKPMRRAA